MKMIIYCVFSFEKFRKWPKFRPGLGNIQYIHCFLLQDSTFQALIREMYCKGALVVGREGDQQRIRQFSKGETFKLNFDAS